MAFTLVNAPYPNVALAFCGAMALQSYLAGRKVCTPGDLMPNLYLLALAGSGAGKDFPRKVNSRVLFEINCLTALGDKFASGEGIQDALLKNNVMHGHRRPAGTPQETARQGRGPAVHATCNGKGTPRAAGHVAGLGQVTQARRRRRCRRLFSLV